MIGFFVLNGKNSRDFNIFCKGSAVYSSPARSVEHAEIPGRSGDIILDSGRYENIDLSYSCSILDNFDKSMREFRTFYASNVGKYVRLEDTYNPDEFRLVSCINGIEVEAEHPNSGAPYRAGNFTVSFSAMPQRFLKSGEYKKQYVSGAKINNPSYLSSKPLIYVFTAGTYEIGNYSFEVLSMGGMDCIVLDSETENVYTPDGVNMNKNVSILNFPVLPSGVTNLKFDAEKIEIVPRWFFL